MAAVLFLTMVGCWDNTPVCVPKTIAPCFCYTGDPGQRECAETGLEYGGCECLSVNATGATVDAGASSDAAPSSTGDEPPTSAEPGR
jgi:hypothetical protein